MKLLIKKTLNLAGWKVMNIEDSSNFKKVDTCVCCLHTLSTLATLQNNDSKNHIRVGCCPNCGFVTLMDKPSHQWIIDFYTNTWSKEEGQRKFTNTESTSSRLLPLLHTLGITKEQNILEIGTGRGGTMTVLKKNGFMNLFGIENSVHRAKEVGEGLNIPIYTGGFEEISVQNSLSKHAPFKVIYTSHVIEHVYDPGEIVGLCSKIQNTGDYLIIAVPNFVGEPSLSVLMFLPHLHSFTKQALSALMISKGYEIVDDTHTTDSEVCIIAKKTNHAIPVPTSSGFLEKAKNKILDELCSSTMKRNQWYYYFFARKGSKNISINNYSHNPLKKLYTWYTCRKNRTRAIIIKKENDDKDITITFPKDIFLFYK